MPYARTERCRVARLFAVLMLFATSPAVGRLQLPPPGDAPQAIDFAADPLLVFLAATALAEEFRVARDSLIDLIRTEQDYIASAKALVRGDIERDLAQFIPMARTGELPGLLTLPILEETP